MRTVVTIALCVALFAVCAPRVGAAEKGEATILVAAAASLRYSFDDELIPMFRQMHPGIAVEATYDSSGKLQAQIENGLGADVFMSAASKQMDALVDKKFIKPESVVPLLENKIVLIRPANGATDVAGFADVLHAKQIAVGDPASVPAGQYAREAFTSLGLWDKVQEKASLGTNVTEVLGWVAEGSADVGVVYATDAATTANVVVVAEAPEGSLKKKVLYPVGVLAGSEHPKEAALFVEFLASDKALAVFEKYGFSPNKR